MCIMYSGTPRIQTTLGQKKDKGVSISGVRMYVKTVFEERKVSTSALTQRCPIREVSL